MDTIVMRSLKYGLWLVVILGLLLGASVDAAESRVALVIGNSDYQNFPRLASPVIDARSFLAELQQRDFTVIYKENATRKEMNKAMGDFIELLSANAVAVVYYSGHGVEINGANYFLPIDLAVEAGLTQAQSERSVVKDALGLQELMYEMSTKDAKFKLLIVDACRDNPFKVQVANGIIGKTIGKPKGLTIETTNADGLMVVYAAGSHQASWDGEPQQNSLFTREFLRAMQQPGLTVQQLVYATKDEVIKQSTRLGSKQTPAIYDQSTGQFVFTAGEPVPIPAPSPSSVVIRPPAVTSPEQVVTEDVRCDYCPEMVDIPAGSFKMGSPKSEKNRDSDEGPVHRVQVKAFRMGKYEVTRGQFRAFVDATSYKTTAEQSDGCDGWTGSSWEQKPEFNWLNIGFAQEDNHPVACVSWDDAVAYTEWLTKERGKHHRLPTEAEWEYAARAGTTTPFWTGNCITTDQANYDGNYDYNNCGAKTGVYRQKTVAVGSFAANPWGLYDTVGNVWEWTCSQYDSYGNSGKETTCANKGNSDARAVRGGSWSGGPYWVRAANRGINTPSDRYGNFLGFRAVQD